MKTWPITRARALRAAMASELLPTRTAASAAAAAAARVVVDGGGAASGGAATQANANALGGGGGGGTLARAQQLTAALARNRRAAAPLTAPPRSTSAPPAPAPPLLTVTTASLSRSAHLAHRLRSGGEAAAAAREWGDLPARRRAAWLRASPAGRALLRRLRQEQRGAGASASAWAAARRRRCVGGGRVRPPANPKALLAGVTGAAGRRTPLVVRARIAELRRRHRRDTSARELQEMSVGGCAEGAEAKAGGGRAPRRARDAAAPPPSPSEAATLARAEGEEAAVAFDALADALGLNDLRRLYVLRRLLPGLAHETPLAEVRSRTRALSRQFDRLRLGGGGGGSEELREVREMRREERARLQERLRQVGEQEAALQAIVTSHTHTGRWV